MEKVYLEIDDIIGKMGIDLNIIATPKNHLIKKRKVFYQILKRLNMMHRKRKWLKWKFMHLNLKMKSKHNQTLLWEIRIINNVK